MLYVALREFDLNMQRVSARARAGGHAASPELLLKIYRASLDNLPVAIRQMDLVEVHDNSDSGADPELVLSAVSGQITYRAPEPPEWLVQALGGSEFALDR